MSTPLLRYLGKHAQSETREEAASKRACSAGGAKGERVLTQQDSGGSDRSCCETVVTHVDASRVNPAAPASEAVPTDGGTQQDGLVLFVHGLGGVPQELGTSYFGRMFGELSEALGGGGGAASLGGDLSGLFAARVAASNGGAAARPVNTLRNQRFTGVFKSRREPGMWRAQFCAGNRVVSLGSWPNEEDAARAWNAAARAFRGGDTWLNPVEPQLPAGYQPGDVFVSSEKAAVAVKEAALAAGILPAPKVMVVPPLFAVSAL